MIDILTCEKIPATRQQDYSLMKSSHVSEWVIYFMGLQVRNGEQSRPKDETLNKVNDTAIAHSAPMNFNHGMAMKQKI